MKLEKIKINFLGDSITEGAGCSGQDKIYHALLAKKYHMDAYVDGIGGSRFARQVQIDPESRADRDFCMRVEEMPEGADAVVVFGGTNDFGHGTAPIGTPEDRTPDTFYGACHHLFARLLERFPDAMIVIMTPLHRSNEDCPHGDNKPSPVGTLSQYVKIICEVAQIYSLPVLDLYRNSGMTPRVPLIKEQMMPDGLHPNDHGHERLAALLEAFLLNSRA